MWKFSVFGMFTTLLVAVIAMICMNEQLLHSVVFWCMTKEGGLVPVILLKLISMLLNKEQMSPGNGLDVPKSLDGKVVVITGSTQGIGFDAACRFHALGAHVVVSGRSPAKSLERAAMIRASGGPGNATGISVELSDFDDVHRFVAEVSAAVESVDFLLLNAGIGSHGTPRLASPEVYMSQNGYDLVYATNYLGGFLLTRLLLPKLAPNATIVLVSSIVMWGARFDLLMPEGGRVPWESMLDADIYQQYQVSKVALCLCFRDSLRQRLQQRGVKIRSMAPGFIVTNMTHMFWNRSSYDPWFWQWLAPTEDGGRVLFESAFANLLDPEHDFLYPFWVPTELLRPWRGQDHWQARVPYGGFFVQLQNYQRLFNMRLHSSISPECNDTTREALWSWSSNATGLDDVL